MRRFLSSIVLDPIDWIAICFVVVMPGGLLLAFFLYFRTTFKAGGWRNVRNSGWIALVALVLFFIERIVQNREIASLKNSVKSLFK